MGRSRKSGKREANGQLSRRQEERRARDQAKVDTADWETMSVALMARWKVHKVEPKKLRDQKAGSAVGRFNLQGHITEEQYAAAEAYLEEFHDYMSAINAPRQPGAVNLNATRGLSVGVENVDRVKAIVEARVETVKAIREKQIEIGNRGNLFGALDAVLVRGVELDHLLGDLRTALNALVRRYRVTHERAA